MKLAHSANQDVPIKFFSTARDDNNSLRDVLLHAILDDCRTTNQASRLGPKPWPWARTQEPSPARNESGVICMHLGRPTQAIRLAVEWGDAAITRSQLQESSQVNNNSLRVELETALLAADYELIKVLTDFKADPSKVRLNRLVGYDLVTEDEETLGNTWSPAHGSDRAPPLRQMSSIARQNTAVIDAGQRGTEGQEWEPRECKDVREQVEGLDEYDRITKAKCPPLKNWKLEGYESGGKEYQRIRAWCDPRSQVGFAVLAHWMKVRLSSRLNPCRDPNPDPARTCTCTCPLCVAASVTFARSWVAT